MKKPAIPATTFAAEALDLVHGGNDQPIKPPAPPISREDFEKTMDIISRGLPELPKT